MIRALFGLAVLACALPYLPGLHGPFLLDDVGNLLRARAPSGTLLDVLDAIVRNDTGDLRRPVANASFLATYHWLGDTPFHYKAVNLVLHLVNGLLVASLARRLLALLPSPRLDEIHVRMLAGWTALAWLLHPIQVSTVLYAVQRMTQLSATFVLLSLLAGLALTRRLTASQAAWPRIGLAAAGMFGLYALATFSKENGALAPLLILAILACAPAAVRVEWWRSPATQRFHALVVAAPLAAGAMALFGLWPRFMDDYLLREFTFAERVLTQPIVLAHYVHTLLWPDIRLMGLYLDDFALRSPASPLAWLGLAIAALLPAIAFGLRRRAPLLAFAVLWFFAAHALESTFIALEMAFEHRNHVAMIGPLLALAYYGHRALSRILAPRAVLLVSSIPLLLAAGLTAQRAHQWSSAERFAENELRNHPESVRALGENAALQIARGNVDAAEALIGRAQALRPTQFWYQAYDLHLACIRNETPPLARLLQVARSRPNQKAIDEAMRPIVGRVLGGRCPSLSPQATDEFLADLIAAISTTLWKPNLERLTILRSEVALHQGDRSGWRSLLLRAAELDPRSVEALSVLAYGELNAGEFDAAERVAALIEQRLSAHHRASKLHQLDELRRQLAVARTEASAIQ